MPYFENEVLKELTVGESYTERQLNIFVVENPDVILISKTGSNFFASNKPEPLKVLEKIEGYVHKSERSDYIIPNKKTVVYITE